MSGGHLCIAVLAHVDAGKTTLSEAMLYLSGAIRRQGRVDNRDAFLDHYELERARGITIFSKQAEFSLGERRVTLLDTPGHTDFSAEMERVLQVLDYAVLVVSGADGVQGHTRTLWRLLKRYGIPVFLFVNKMDQPGSDREALLAELRRELDDRCVAFDVDRTEEAFLENAAVCDERAMEQYLETGGLEPSTLAELIRERKLFPCYFGSALRLEGVDRLLEGLSGDAVCPAPGSGFGAKVFKISRDEQGGRLTWLRVTGGELKVKDLLTGGDGEERWEEKVNQIRIYSGGKYETVGSAGGGQVCAVTGLTRTRPGDGLGEELQSELPVLEPVLSYRMALPRGCDPVKMLEQMRLLEDEEPELHVRWDEKLREIQVQLMGEVQIGVLRTMIRDRFDVSVDFDEGNIVYKETIRNTVEGVGHFEPLRHYAEVHLLMEPGEPGSGLQFASSCSEDLLDRNWQRLILTHLEEKAHKGVLTGSEITDMRITLASGKAHAKHTEGGDFRQATYRAVRQGLMSAECSLLEPYYEFRLELPSGSVGRAMSDLERMGASVSMPELDGETAVLTGSAPVASLRNYQQEVTSYTQGRGRLSCTLKGYGPCRDPEAVLEACGYDPEADTENPSCSVFCYHGAGTIVPWYEAPEHMHLESALGKKYGAAPNGEDLLAEGGPGLSGAGLQGGSLGLSAAARAARGKGPEPDGYAQEKELQEIFARTFGAPKARTDSDRPRRRSFGTETETGTKSRPGTPRKKLPEYLLVDGYNVIFAWEELSELAKVSLDSARGKLLDVMCNYQGFRQCSLIVVFDAYRVEGHEEETVRYHNIHVVYTKEAETADQYIERTAHEIGRKYQVTVATSDGMEQIIIRGQGCAMMSARELKEETERVSREIREQYVEQFPQSRNYLFDDLPEELAARLREVRMGRGSFDEEEE